MRDILRNFIYNLMGTKFKYNFSQPASQPTIHQSSIQRMIIIRSFIPYLTSCPPNKINLFHFQVLIQQQLNWARFTLNIKIDTRQSKQNRQIYRQMENLIFAKMILTQNIVQQINELTIINKIILQNQILTFIFLDIFLFNFYIKIISLELPYGKRFVQSFRLSIKILAKTCLFLILFSVISQCQLMRKVEFLLLLIGLSNTQFITLKISINLLISFLFLFGFPLSYYPYYPSNIYLPIKKFLTHIFYTFIIYILKIFYFTTIQLKPAHSSYQSIPSSDNLLFSEPSLQIPPQPKSLKVSYFAVFIENAK
ncbi:transmembrane protein, putative (macronuclear) [Tetrahymena thermophila SB210]|uniref:Transmembrane protein, putative n=1 Tax=Tetrahymena thermophila (strain SB210) TaxID=312017 RepID=W7XL79_TETTS|nr:transmembrane protein, putative [Tetrahymena thermophila SB210]EWS75819.1 transmembrane protein, putative [Tetrahymena thermophila SB210]|eukprot:XP_012651633.1 transmembrane protein, putative [Tetrahymena thermophila SB210]